MWSSVILRLLLTLVWFAHSTVQDCCAAGCLDASQTLNLGDTLQSITLDNSSQYNSSEICGAVFANKGSCCQMSRMKSYTSKMVNRIKAALLGIEGTLGVAPQIITALPRIMNVVRDKVALGGVFPDQIFVDTLGGGQNFEQMKVMVEYLSTQISSLTKLISEKKYNTTKCYDTLLRSKLSSVCFACSGNASDYYDESTKRFRIKRSYCTNLVQDCAQVFDVYNKVNTVLKISRMFRIAMTSSQTDETFPVEFSLDRMQSYDACLANLADCLKNDQKMLAICRDFNVLADVTLIKLSANSNTDAAQINSDAAGAYASALTGQVFLYTNIVNNVNSNMQEYGTTAGIQSKMTTLVTTMASLGTQEGTYGSADNTIKAAALNTDTLSSRSTRRTAINQILPFRNSVYTNVAAISKKIITDLATDMAAMNPTEFEIRKPFYLQLEKLYVLISEAQNQYTVLSQAKAEFDAYEATLTSPMTTYDMSKELNYFMLYENFTAVHKQVVIEYDNAKTQMLSFSKDKETSLLALKTAYESYKTIVTRASNKLQPQLVIETKTLQQTYMTNNITLETFKQATLTKYQADITLLKTNYDTLSNNMASNYGTFKAALTTMQTSLTGLLSQISSISSSSFYSGITSLLNSVNGFLASATTATTSLTAALNTQDPVLDSANPSYQSKLRAGVAGFITDITNLASQKTTANQAILKSNADLGVAYANQQTALFKAFSALSQFEVLYNNYTAATTALMDNLVNYAGTDGMMWADLLKQQALLALLASGTNMFLPCALNPVDAACGAATTAIATANSEVTRLTAARSTLTTTTWPSSYATIKTQRDTLYTSMTAQATTLRGLDLMTAGWSANITTTLKNIDTEKANIINYDITATLKTNQIAFLNTLIAKYQTASQNAPVGDVTTQMMFLQDSSRFLTDLATLLTTIGSNTTVPPTNYTNALTTQNTGIGTLVTRATTLESTQNSKKATILANLDGQLTATASELTLAAANITAMTSQATTLTSEVSVATAQFNAARRRRLQTRQSDEDFILSEINGADVTVQFAAGVDPVVDLSSLESYTAGNLSLGGNLTNNATDAHCRLISVGLGVALVLSIMQFV